MNRFEILKLSDCDYRVFEPIISNKEYNAMGEKMPMGDWIRMRNNQEAQRRAEIRPGGYIAVHPELIPTELVTPQGPWVTIDAPPMHNESGTAMAYRRAQEERRQLEARQQWEHERQRHAQMTLEASQAQAQNRLIDPHQLTREFLQPASQQSQIGEDPYALNAEELQERFINPAARRLAQQIDRDLIGRLNV